MSGVSLNDLNTPTALTTFQTAIVRAVANSLSLSAAGGSVTTPVVTAGTASGGRRMLSQEQGQGLGVVSQDQGQGLEVWSTSMLIPRWLQSTGGVNVAYSVIYPYTQGGTTGATLTTQLQQAIAGGAVTSSLVTYGFPKASANAVFITIATASPTPAPSFISPGKIAAASVCSILGFCALIGRYRLHVQNKG